MIAQPLPKRDVMARRDSIVAGLRAVLPATGVIAETLLLKPYETDGLAIYRQPPMAVVLQIMAAARWTLARSPPGTTVGGW